MVQVVWKLHLQGDALVLLGEGHTVEAELEGVVHTVFHTEPTLAYLVQVAALVKLNIAAVVAAAVYVVREVTVVGLARPQPQVVNLTSNGPFLDPPLSLVLAAVVAE